MDITTILSFRAEIKKRTRKIYDGSRGDLSCNASSCFAIYDCTEAHNSFSQAAANARVTNLTRMMQCNSTCLDYSSLIYGDDTRDTSFAGIAHLSGKEYGNVKDVESSGSRVVRLLRWTTTASDLNR